MQRTSWFSSQSSSKRLRFQKLESVDKESSRYERVREHLKGGWSLGGRSLPGMKKPGKKKPGRREALESPKAFF